MSEKRARPVVHATGTEATVVVLNDVRAAGYLLTYDEEDGVWRIRAPRGIDGDAPKLVGMLVVREGRIRYAEMCGRVFGCWGGSEADPVHVRSLRLLLAHIEDRRRK